MVAVLHALRGRLHQPRRAQTPLPLPDEGAAVSGDDGGGDLPMPLAVVLFAFIGSVVLLMTALVLCVTVLAIYGTWDKVTGHDTPAEQENR